MLTLKTLSEFTCTRLSSSLQAQDRKHIADVSSSTDQLPNTPVLNLDRRIGDEECHIVQKDHGSCCKGSNQAMGLGAQEYSDVAGMIASGT